jgi:hypothetical protein
LARPTESVMFLTNTVAHNTDEMRFVNPFRCTETSSRLLSEDRK